MRSIFVGLCITADSTSFPAAIDLFLSTRRPPRRARRSGLPTAGVPSIHAVSCSRRRPERARPHAADLSRGDESGLFEDAHVLLHPRRVMSNFSARSVIDASHVKLLEHTATGGVGQRRERASRATL